GGDCSVTVNETFPDGSHDWYVRGWNDTGNGDWSDGMSFTVKSSEMEKDINEVIGMITSVEDLSPMIEEIGTLLGEVMNGDPSFITIDPSGDLDLANLPSEITITANLGNGYTPEGSSSVLTGNMVIKITNLSFDAAGIFADISLDADDIRRDGQLILDGGMTLGVNAGISGSSLSVTVDIDFANLKSLDFQVNGAASVIIPSIDLSGELTSSQPIIINFQQFTTLDYQISGDVELIPDGDVYDIDFDLDTNQGDVAGTVRVDGTNPDRIIISTPGSTLKAGDYTLDINNVVMASDVCTDSPSSGNIVVTDNLETKTITFNNNCDYTIN
nr:hypothetical protein [Spirochaetales bacterium]